MTTFDPVILRGIVAAFEAVMKQRLLVEFVLNMHASPCSTLDCMNPFVGATDIARLLELMKPLLKGQ
jgi:Icc-related predicted phosphoesterase